MSLALLHWLVVLAIIGVPIAVIAIILIKGRKR